MSACIHFKIVKWILVAGTGFEPATPWLWATRATELLLDPASGNCENRTHIQQPCISFIMKMNSCPDRIRTYTQLIQSQGHYRLCYRAIIFLRKKIKAAHAGIEPTFTVPKTAVLPLDEWAIDMGAHNLCPHDKNWWSESNRLTRFCRPLPDRLVTPAWYPM